MKLSNKDKNLVAMSWLVEVLLNGLAQEKDVPESKKEMYDELTKNYQTALDIVTDINKEFDHDINTVFGYEFKEELINLTTVLSILYQTVPVPKMLDYFKWIGQNNLLQQKSKKNIEETKADDVLVELDNGDVVLPISFNDKK